MIRTKLIGGLGNQMFQYAAARALAEKYHTDVELDLTWFSQPFDAHTAAREYELNSFILDSRIEKYSASLADKVRQRLRLIKTYSEPHFHYDPKFQQLGNNTSLVGYFQTEKYFKGYRKQLLQDFVWQSAPTGKNMTLMAKIMQDENSVSLHVRRGDYVADKVTASFHGSTKLDYYKAALKTLKKHVPRPTLYVFSDEPDWCKQNLKFSDPTIFVSHNTHGSEDMRLMKTCRHNIIANSSFSWWGAWLNQNPEKIVIAPQQWFAHQESNTKDIIPSSWQKI